MRPSLLHPSWTLHQRKRSCCRRKPSAAPLLLQLQTVDVVRVLAQVLPQAFELVLLVLGDFAGHDAALCCYCCLMSLLCALAALARLRLST